MPKVKSISEKFWKMNRSMNILVGEFWNPFYFRHFERKRTVFHFGP